MTRSRLTRLFAAAPLLATLGGSAFAQTATPAPAPAPTAAPTATKTTPDALSVFFAPGMATPMPDSLAVLDQAARLYRDGRPIVMVVAGATDATGTAEGNLALSQQRAVTVLRALVARGIPAERFQVLAKGQTDPAVPAPDGSAEARNRRVDISWR